MRVSVIGGGDISSDAAELAYDLGVELAQRDHTVVCGGLGGTMEAVCRGASAAGGQTIGILPGTDRSDANPHVDIAIATGLGHARNALVPLNGTVTIALPGGPGTHTELGFATIYDRPVISLDTYEGPGIQSADSPAEAVRVAEQVGPVP